MTQTTRASARRRVVKTRKNTHVGCFFVFCFFVLFLFVCLFLLLLFVLFVCFVCCSFCFLVVLYYSLVWGFSLSLDKTNNKQQTTEDSVCVCVCMCMCPKRKQK